jgi:hypothetical protein
MQDCYTGDIGDYVKYALLRKLAEGHQLGVAWYLFPDENRDGGHTKYLQDPDHWSGHDPKLFNKLKQIVEGDKRGVSRRKVSQIEESGILGTARFSSEILFAPKLTPAQRRDWRSRWFENVLAELEDCDVVFADPDNGLCEDEKFRPGRVKHWKRLRLCEAKALAKGRTAIIYHHNTRRRGGHEQEIAYWKGRLGPGTLALRWRRYGNRTFFVMNPAPNMDKRLEKFAREWGQKAEVYR